MDGVQVQVGTGNTVAAFKVAQGTDNQNMSTTTPSPQQATGTYKFTNVPDGTWSLLMSKDGYITAIVTGVVVNHNTAAQQVDQTLTRVTHQVTVQLTSTNGFSLLGAQANLAPTPPPPPPADQSPTNPTEAPVAFAFDANLPGPAVRFAATFNAVPFGTWNVWVTNLPANHFGTVTSGGSAVTAASPLLITVSSTPSPGGADTTASLTLTEGQVNVSAVATTLPDDPTPANKPTSLTVSITNTPFTGQNITVGAAPVQVYLTPGSYTASVSTNLPTNWQLNNASLSFSAPSGPNAANAAITITELGASVTVNVTRVNAAGNRVPVTGAAVTLIPPTGSTITSRPPPALPPTTDSNGNTTFTNVPFASGWTAHATSGNGANQLAGTSASFTVPIPNGPNGPPPPAIPVTVS
jgi:hypothetical protein